MVIAEDESGETGRAGFVENYLGFPGISGFDLAIKFKEHLSSYQPKMVFQKVVSLKKDNGNFLIKTDKEEFISKSVIVATGSVAQRMDVKGEKEFFNKGISYCETCDGPLFRDKKVAVVGGGNSAIKAALSLADICKEVTILSITSELRGEKIMTDKLKNKKNIKMIFETKILEFKGDKMLKNILYQDLKTSKENSLEIDGAFIYVGFLPNTSFIDKSLGILNEKGEIVIDKTGKTNIPGLFAAGNVADFPYKQISIAVGSGTLACLAALDYLKQK